MPTRLHGEHRGEIDISRIASAPSLALYLDLDAALAPMAPTPHLAWLEPEMRSVLEELSRLEGLLVCVLSGRPVAEVKQRVDIPGLVHSGDHGLEVDGEAIRFMHPEAARCRAALEQLNQRLSGLPLLVPGVEVEPRPLATTIHFPPGEHGVHGRLGATVRSLILAEQLDLRVVEGTTSVEVYPRLDWNEGAAMAWVHQRIKTKDVLAFVIGGNSSEESVFRAIDGAITVQVGPGNSTQARYWLDGPEEVASLLSWLFELWIRRLDRVDPAWPRAAGRPVLALKEASPILNVRLRRAAIGRRRQASG